jgi:hypothetical protein
VRKLSDPSSRFADEIVGTVGSLQDIGKALLEMTEG